MDTVERSKREGTTIAVRGAPGVRLRTVHATPAEDDVALITDWRNRFRSAFLSEFEATPERTRRWLSSAVAADDSRILFMVEVPHQPPFGHIGLAEIDHEARYAELDSVVRGAPGRPGAMRAAAEELMAWAVAELGVERLGLRVFAENPAVRFYERLGFREVERIGLTRVGSPDEIRWVPSDEPSNSTRWLLRMELPR